MTALIRSNICKGPTIRRLLPSLVKITWPMAEGMFVPLHLCPIL